MKNILGKTTLSVILIASPQLSYSKEYTVKMISANENIDYSFEPKELHIKSGDTVTWLNMQDEGHNVMAESVPKEAESFSSPPLEKNGEKWSYTFKTSGTYKYHCHPHAAVMSGVIIVDKPSAPAQVKEINDNTHEHKQNR